MICCWINVLPLYSVASVNHIHNLSQLSWRWVGKASPFRPTQHGLAGPGRERTRTYSITHLTLEMKMCLAHWSWASVLSLSETGRVDSSICHPTACLLEETHFQYSNMETDRKGIKNDRPRNTYLKKNNKTGVTIWKANKVDLEPS